MTDSTRAKITTVNIGNLKIEGVLLPDGTFGITIPQVFNLLEISQKNANRDLLWILATDVKGLTLPHAKREISLEDLRAIALTLPHAIKTEVHDRALNVLTLDEFDDLLSELCIIGQQKAIELTRLLRRLSLVQLWSDAFGVKFEAEDRQAWLKARQDGKECRRDLTDAIRDYIERHPELSENYARFIYSNCSNWLNKAIMKGTAKQLREKLVVPKNSLLRDYIPQAAVKELALIEEYAKRLIDEDEVEPYEATKTACIVMKAKTISIE